MDVVGQQSTVTKDVAVDIAKVAAGVDEANASVSQTSIAANTLATETAENSTFMEQIRQSGDQVRRNATELAKLAENLQSLVGQFKA